MVLSDSGLIEQRFIYTQGGLMTALGSFIFIGKILSNCWRCCGSEGIGRVVWGVKGLLCAIICINQDLAMFNYLQKIA